MEEEAQRQPEVWHLNRRASFIAIDFSTTQRYCCVVAIPALEPSGLLPPGIHCAEWAELALRFGSTPYRRRILHGLYASLKALQAAGCMTAYINGSFVTSKDFPADFDGCWDVTGVDVTRLDPVLLDFDNGRGAQKARFLGELFPPNCPKA